MKLIYKLTNPLSSFRRNALRLYTLLLFSFLLSPFSSFSQISAGGTPPSFIFESENEFLNSTINLPIEFDVVAMRAEDAISEAAGFPPNVGKIIPVHFTTENSGEWTTLPNGQVIWRLCIIAEDAIAIMLTYDKFEIPVGGKLFIYNDDRSRVLGAYTEANNPKRVEYATEFISGDQITLEYVAPAANNFDSPIIITGVVYGYNYLQVHKPKGEGQTRIDFGASGSCMLNVTCPEGNNWTNEKRGVLRIVTPKGGSSYSLCSGTVINNTAGNLDPLFLSAFHCYHGLTPAQVNQSVYYTNYEHPTCSGRSDPTVPTLVGATILVSIPLSAGSDGMLLRLNENIPQSYNVYYNGWDRRNTAPANGVGIHHPHGDVKKISTYTSAYSDGNNYFGDDWGTTAANSNWSLSWVATTSGHSTTQGGSSGSPLFNSSKRVVGTLSGGNSGDTPCTNPSTKYSIYGKLWYHWDQKSSADQKMKPYLDPINSGAEYIDGIYTATANTYNYTVNITTSNGVSAAGAVVKLTHTSGAPVYTVTATSGTVPFSAVVQGTYNLTITKSGYYTYTANNININANGLSHNALLQEMNCTISSFPHIQSFEGNGTNFPNCWDQVCVTSNLNWILTSSNAGYPSAAQHGTYMAVLKNEQYSAQVTKLVSPPFNLTSISNPVLEFWHYQAVWGSDQDELRVYYKTSATGSWNLLNSYTTNVSEWTKRTINLPSSSSTYYIAFEGTAKYGYGVCIDNVQINGGSTTTCNPPTNLAVNYATGCASAQITWSAPTGKGGETEPNPEKMIIANETTPNNIPTERRVMGASSITNNSKNSYINPLSQHIENSSPNRAVIFSEGFESSNHGAPPTGWTLSNAGTGDSWKAVEALYSQGVPVVYPHSGSRFATNLWLEDGTRNAWMFSPGFALTQGVTYNISFWVQMAGYEDERDRLEVKMAQSPTATAMSSGFEVYYNINTAVTTWTKIEKSFTPTTTGTYYLGFHAFSLNNMGNDIDIDDIEVSTGGSSGLTYNVYRDGTKIAPNITTTSYTDATFSSSVGHTWSVETVCQSGTSSQVSVTKPACNPPADCNPPTNLAVNYASGCASAQITWNAPAKGGTEGRAIISDGAENHSDFAVNSPGTVGWTYYSNGSNTWGIQGVTFPNSGGNFAYIVFNPSATTPSMSGNTEIQPHTGQKFFASFATLPPSSGGIQPNNHWIVSPQLNATGNITFSFWAKTFHSDFPERMKVRYSTTNNQQASFTQYLAGSASAYVTVPDTWTFYTYTVPTTAKYVAIQCVSDDAFIFMVDDITIDTGGPSTVSYNVYRDGNPIATNITTTSYSDATYNSLVGHTWSVATVCTSGTSQQTSITKDACFIPVTNITGIPTTATATLAVTLNGTVIPTNANNKTIVWSVVTPNTAGGSISGNTLNTTTNGTTTVRATITNGLTPTSPYTQDFTITVNKATLTGTVTTTGNMVWGQTLTANTSALSSTPVVSLGTLSYQWKRGGESISGATNSTYTLVQADIGQTVNVQVTAANCSGTVTSANTGTVTKATQTAPAAPTKLTQTSTSITLNTVTGCEYNINGGAYQTSNVFSGLNPGTSYNFTQRKAGTDTHLPSPASTSASFSTDGGAAPALVGTVTISGNAVFGQTLSAIPNVTSNPPGSVGELFYQWKRANVSVGSNASTYTLTKDDIGATMTVTVTAAGCTGSVTSSPTATVTKATQTAPAAPTLNGKTATSITLNIVAECEYNINGGAYQGLPIFSGLTPNNTYVFTQRKAETATHSASPASLPAHFTTDNTNATLYTIVSYVNNPAFGTITPNGENKVEEGKSIAFTITPYKGYIIESVLVNSINQGPISSYTFTKVKEDGIIAAIFTEDVGIAESPLSDIKVYPNPTTGQLTIDNGQLTIESVEIFDIYGRKVGSKFPSNALEGWQPKADGVVIDLTVLSPGLYFVKIKTDLGEVVRKVVKE